MKHSNAIFQVVRLWRTHKIGFAELKRIVEERILDVELNLAKLEAAHGGKKESGSKTGAGLEIGDGASTQQHC
jgi:hypothetical protein